MDPFEQHAKEADSEAAAAKAARNAAQTEAEDMAWLMDSARGRRIAWRVLDRCGINAHGFSPEPGALAFLTGRRSVGLEFQALAQAGGFEPFIQMLREATEPK